MADGETVTIQVTFTEGQKPIYNVTAGWNTKLVDFNVSVTNEAGETVVVPSFNFNEV